MDDAGNLLPPPQPSDLPAWQTLLDALGQPAWLVAAADARIVGLNAPARALLALGAQPLDALHAEQLVATPEDLAFWAEVRAGHIGQLDSDTVAVAADGRLLQITRRIQALPAADGSGPTHLLVTAVDRSAAMAEQAEREALVAELQATLDSTGDGILVTDLAGRIRAFNRRFAQIWALPDELLGRHQDEAVYDWIRRSMVDPLAWQRRLASIQEAAMLRATECLQLHGGQMVELVTHPQCSRGRPIGRVWSFRDLSDLVAAERRIETLATTDALTGLPNRRQFSELLAATLTQARQAVEPVALLLVDLDRFKQINDSLGQDVGDGVLTEVGQRLQGCLRPDDLVARVGGDQFALVLREAERRGAESTAHRVLEAVAQEFSIDGMPFTLTCSVGVALHPEHGLGASDLMRHAESAMMLAKQGGRAGWRVHQSGHDPDLRERIRLDHAMRRALASKRFRLDYQPQVDLATGAVVGAEALIRWRDPEWGEVSPVRFIPVAEDTGFIVPIGDWVLTQAARQAARWRAAGRPLPVAVNVSALQFQQADFVQRVAEVLRANRLPGELLELELTESILVHDADEALQRLSSLAQLGVRLAIDDFGTGYSSLAYLKRFPIERLKIDRSFIRGLPGDESDVGIVRAIVQMARALNLTTIAEGVETESQRQFLEEAGCTQFQGWLFAPAMDALSFERRVHGAEPSPSPSSASSRQRHLRVVGS